MPPTTPGSKEAKLNNRHTIMGHLRGPVPVVLGGGPRGRVLALRGVLQPRQLLRIAGPCAAARRY